jgi:hypothetical protein
LAATAGDLAHHEGRGVDGGRDVACSDLLEARAGVAVIAEQQQILAAERFCRLGRAHDLVVVGGENHLDLRMCLQHVHRRDVPAFHVPLSVKAGDHSQVRAFDRIEKAADAFGRVIARLPLENPHLHGLAAGQLERVLPLLESAAAL